jgi:Rrf2 family iron-sulfur cluster assembly transcriptional regulator
VINAVDEELQIADKDVSNGSPSYEPCLTEQLWEELSVEIHNYLTTISLADMMQNDEVQELSRAHDLRQNQPDLL